MSISERLRAHARMLRDQAAQLDVEATLADQSPSQHRTYVASAPSLATAMEHVPLCHRTNQPHPLSSCLGCHPEGE